MPGRTHPLHENWKVSVKGHPGSTADEIENEPEWEDSGDEHHIGFKNRQGRRPGFTHTGDEGEHHEEVEEALRVFHESKKEVQEKGHLVNFRDAFKNEKDFHLKHPEGRSLGWRYVLDYSEDKIKNEQDWPANVKKREAEKLQKNEERQKKKDSGEQSGQRKDQQGHGQKTNQEEQPRDQQDSQQKEQQDGGEGEDQQLSPQEEAFLRAVSHEREYMANIASNDGKGHAHIKNRSDITIDEADQFTPDNWVPRSQELIRLTGKHPLNAEAPLSRIFEAGFITPNEIHYVRNHGAVPRLLWETHVLEIVHNGISTKISMNDLRSNFDTLNLPVFISCDNGRRKEMNMIKRTKGFNWGPGAVGCAYWKGPLLRDVLISAGVPDEVHGEDKQRYFVHFRGADNPSDRYYETSIPFEYAMDPTNDVLLAYEMNDVPLPPDHGYPVRVVIPGYVGGRQVKWLEKIWISTKENDSYYHIHDNRVLPSFVTETESEISKFFFRHPDTAAYEQNLNSLIVSPAQGERLEVRAITKGQRYRIQGLAYNGRGDEVQRVEVSLDEGKSWLYCIRSFPKAPLRHGRKFWTWCFWHVEVDTGDLVKAKGITVRCFDVKKMPQPEKPIWNLLGTMNNCQYTVRSEFVNDEKPHFLFRHPVEPASGEGGWMTESEENKVADAEQKTGAPAKEFTRAEIEKHDSQQDCWIVVDGRVYDATSVLDWHPGGAAAVMTHAGRVHQETTTEFSSIHDGYAYQKLNECILGVVTDKAKKYIERTAKEEEEEKAHSHVPSDQAMQKHRWAPVKLVERNEISEDSRTYKFQLPKGTKYLGIGTCQHVQFGFHMRDRMLIRPYTPTKPIFPKDSGAEVADKELHDGTGFMELTVKTYFPSDEQPGGALSNILDTMSIGEEIEIRGPTGDIVYLGHGKFNIYGEEKTFKRVSLVLGGTGLTPGYSLIARVCLTPDDETELRVIDANKSENDILLRENLEKFEKESKGNLKVAHILSHASDQWQGLKGHIDENNIKEHLFSPSDQNLVLLCGPPVMIEKAALPALEDWGYKHNKNMFGL